MPWVGDGVKLFHRVRRRVHAESAANDDVIVPGLCRRHRATSVSSFDEFQHFRSQPGIVTTIDG
jgi:hypothetical protein